MTFWGFPADESHEAQRFPKGEPGHPTGCPSEEGTACNTKPARASIPDQPLIDNPTTCTGENLTSTLEVETYAWTVLPPELQPADLALGIAEELRWFRSVQAPGKA